MYSYLVPDDIQVTIEDGVVEEAIAAPFWAPVAPIWKFLVHTVVGILIFVIIGAAAVGIDLGVQSLEPLHVSTEIVVVLKLGAWAILATDIFLLFVFLFKTARRMVREL